MYDIINGGQSYQSQSCFTLGNLIDLLNDHPNRHVKFLETDLTIGKLCSWRGSYDIPSVTYDYSYEGKLASVIAGELEYALTHDHTGWKGGQYSYSKEDEFYVSEKGTSQEYKVVDAKIEDEVLVLYTKIVPY
jgi:hypothetical protein